MWFPFFAGPEVGPNMMLFALYFTIIKAIQGIHNYCGSISTAQKTIEHAIFN